MKKQIFYILISATLFLLISSKAYSEEIILEKGQSIQSAIDASGHGDVIVLGNGIFLESIDFKGKAITLKGKGRKTILSGTGDKPVITFQGGENSLSIVESLTISDGKGENGGGIFISNSSPTIRKNIITMNTAVRAGSGIYIEGNSSPLITNNLISFNKVTTNGGDPHTVQIVSASPTLINNTIGYGDSNGIFISGDSNATILNNIIAFNGTRVGNVRGRGICEFGGESVIQYNLFFGNARAAFLSRDSMDFNTIVEAQNLINEERLSNNLDGNPRFRNPEINILTLRRRSNAIDMGSPLESFNDRNSTRNDIGFTGGPDSFRTYTND